MKFPSTTLQTQKSVMTDFPIQARKEARTVLLLFVTAEPNVKETADLEFPCSFLSVGQ